VDELFVIVIENYIGELEVESNDPV